jgi:tRNA-specific adenosine deaminase 1
MKCLPSSKLSSSRGVGLHDWHAEILAIRAFNHFLLDECRRQARGDDGKFTVLKWREIHEQSVEKTAELSSQPYALKEDVTLHMYCSEAPCRCSVMPILIC